jgi:hypothetical protein
MSHLSKAEEIEQQFDHLAQSGAFAQAGCMAAPFLAG